MIRIYPGIFYNWQTGDIPIKCSDQGCFNTFKLSRDAFFKGYLGRFAFLRRLWCQLTPHSYIGFLKSFWQTVCGGLVYTEICISKNNHL